MILRTTNWVHPGHFFNDCLFYLITFYCKHNLFPLYFCSTVLQQTHTSSCQSRMSLYFPRNSCFSSFDSFCESCCLGREYDFYRAISPHFQNLDGACIQSVNLVVDEDPKSEITLSHVGEVFMAGQYRISLPYSDGKKLLSTTTIVHFKCPTSSHHSAGHGWNRLSDGSADEQKSSQYLMHCVLR